MLKFFLHLSFEQWCASGSVCFRASWIRILPSPSKSRKENFDSYCFATSLWLLIFKKWCGCAGRICIKTSRIRNNGEGSKCSTVGYLLRILLASSRSIRNSRIRVHWSKARIRIRSNMSRIPNTGFKKVFPFAAGKKAMALPASVFFS